MPTMQKMEKAMGPKPGSCETSCMQAAEYFAAKLQCEMTPWTLKGMMDKGMMQDCCVIDVRPAADFQKCRIPQAMCVPMDELCAKMASLPKDKMIVAYCGDQYCHLSAKACLELAQKGFKTMMLAGGMQAWLEKRFPTTK